MGCLKLNIENSTLLRLFNGGNWVVSKKDENLYRYGFNGQEKDDEVKGEGNSLDFGARIYDARVARFLSLDNYASKQSGVSPYSFASNMPISAVDINGDSTFLILYGSGQQATGYLAGTLGDSGYESALARKTAIENSADFDKTVDEVMIVYTPTESDAVNSMNQKYISGAIKHIDIYSHGSNVGINFGGPVVSGAKWPEDDDQDGRMLSSSDQSRNSTNKGENEMLNIDDSNFGSGAKIYLWSCYSGGAIIGSMNTNARAQNYSPAQGLADVTGAIVYASFNSGMQFKTDASGNNIYDGTMIRDKDVKSQKTNMTEYKPGNRATDTSPNKVVIGGGL